MSLRLLQLLRCRTVGIGGWVSSRRGPRSSIGLALGSTLILLVLLITSIVLVRSTAIGLVASLPRVGIVGGVLSAVRSLRSATLLAETRCLSLSSSVVCVGDWARNVFWRIVGIKSLVDGCRDGFNFRAKLLLNPIEVEAIIPIDKVYRHTKMTKAAGTTDTMKIRLCILGEVKVDHNIDSLNIDTPRQKI